MTNKDELKNIITTTMLSTFREEKFKLSLNSMFKNELRVILVSNKNDFFQSYAYKSLEETLYNTIKNFGNSLKFKNSLYAIFDKKFTDIEKSNCTFSKLIPTTFTNSLKVYVYNNKDTFAISIKALLNSKKVQDKIKNEIIKAIDSLNPMASKFVNGDKIYYKISSGINSYFDNQENLMDMVMMINGSIDKLMQRNVSDFTSYLPREGRNSLIDAFCAAIISNLFTDETINKVILSMKEKLNDETFIKNFINTNHKVFSGLLDDLSDKYYGKILESEKFKEVIDDISGILVDKLLEIPLKEFI